MCVKQTLLLANLLGSQDVKQAYRRSVFGPFWITAAMALQIGTITLVFGLIFRNPLNEYLPFVATSIILWSFMATSLNEGCLSFIVSDGIIKQLSLNMAVYPLRTLWKNTLTFGHNIIILPIVFLFSGKEVTASVFLFIPGILLLIANLFWIMILLAVVSARFRDVPQVISSLLMMLVYVTPVFWYPENLGNGSLSHLLLGLNPFYHILQVARLPLLGEFPTFENWAITSSLAAFGLVVALALLRRVKGKVAYWL